MTLFNHLRRTIPLLVLLIVTACQSQPAAEIAVTVTPTPTDLRPTATHTPPLPEPTETTNPTNTPVPPTNTPENSATPLPPTPTETPESTTIASTLFDIPWDDRTIFQSGLLDSEQAVLSQLPGATIYHLDLKIEADIVHLNGRQEIRYTNQEDQPLDKIVFRLFPNIAGGASIVTNVTVDGEAIEPTFTLEQSAMELPLSFPLQSGEQLVIGMDVSIEVPADQGGNYGTFAYLDQVMALAHFYPMIAVFDDEGWNVEIAPPIGDVVYADSSFYIVRITAPADQTVVASGVEVSREVAGDQQIITFAAGPMRDFYMAVSDTYVLTSRTVDGITINSYAPAALTEGSELTLDIAEASILSFNERFGPYPYTEFDLISTTTSALGIEYPGIVALLNDLYEIDGQPQGTLLEAVVAHEVAHQWFYALVGNDQVDEPWLDEAMAQFATTVYYSDVYGPSGGDRFRSSLERRWNRVDKADIAIGQPVRAYTPSEYGAIVYGRGPLFIEALSMAMTPEVFADFIKVYYQQYRWQIATGEDYKQLAEQFCDCDLTALFEEWVYPQ
ncbi:MAG: M1 family metallopeptidase [Chloroflexota bacterium]